MRIFRIVILASVYYRSCTATPRDAHSDVELPYVTPGGEFTSMPQDDSDLDLSWLNDFPPLQDEDTEMMFDVDDFLEYLASNNDDSVGGSSLEGRSLDREDSLESPNSQMSSSSSRNVDSSFGINEPREFSDNAPVQPLKIQATPKLLRSHLHAWYSNKEAELLPLQCTSSEARYESKEALSTHVGMCHKGKAAVAIDEAEAAVNDNEVAINEARRCSICQNTFASPQSFRRHVRSYHPDDVKSILPHQCESCGKSYKSPRSLSCHIGTVHKGEAAVVIDEAEAAVNDNEVAIEAARRCAICQKTFFSPQAFRRHVRSYHPDDVKSILPHQCKSCGKSYKSPRSLSCHIGTVHKGEAAVVNPKKPSRCAICQKTFSSPHSFRRHVRIHHRNKEAKILPYLCCECGSRFPTQQSLGRHNFADHRELTLKNRKTFPCRHCDRQFALARSLWRHMKTAHPEVPRS